MKKKVVRLEYVLDEGQNLVGLLNCIVGSINEGKTQGSIPVYQLTATDWITDLEPVADSEVKKAIRDLELEAPTIVKKPPQDRRLMEAITERNDTYERH